MGRQLLFYLLLSLGVAGPQAVLGAEPAKVTKAGAKKKTKAKNASESASEHLFGIGLGIFNFYPPQPTVEAGWRFRRYAASVEAGSYSITIGEFSGEASYTGVSGRYLIGDAFYAGMGFGKRRIEVTTEAAIVVNGEPFPIKWTRVAEQTTVAPKAGWEAFSDSGSSLLFSFGVLVPLSTTFTISRNVDVVPGLPNEDLKEEEETKANDVSQVTNATLPYFELKYAYYF